MHSKALRKLSKTTTSKSTPPTTTLSTDQKDNSLLFYSLVALSSVTLTTLGYFGYKYYKKSQEQEKDCVETLVIDMTGEASYMPGEINENKLEVEELPENDDEL